MPRATPRACGRRRVPPATDRRRRARGVRPQRRARATTDEGADARRRAGGEVVRRHGRARAARDGMVQVRRPTTEATDARDDRRRDADPEEKRGD